ncbi:hypothetical protein WR25_13599 [Diploscapter pachys]|uniref:DUF3752 domain-containing protein n=1 Tax=Diploscapter pachys TaxID=2018661 RepID=A0A2A2KNP6_9BILA|nr:hypothetical protein WR25_13599 [Diploscapter pachys]
MNSNNELPRVEVEDPHAFIGPSIPSVMNIGSDQRDQDNSKDSAPDDPSDDPEDPSFSSHHHSIGPSLPTIGPAIPSTIRMNSDLPTSSSNASASSSHLPEAVGPSLPDDGLGLNSNAEPEASSSSRPVIGPSIPDFLLNGAEEEEDEEEEENLFGPMPPPPPSANNQNQRENLEMPEEEEEEEEEESDEQIGPQLPQAKNDDQEEYEYMMRLAALKQGQSEQKTSKREEWMTQLPKKLTNYGLGPRTFRKGGAAQADASWVDTPEQKRRKIDNGDDQPGPSTAEIATRKRDEEQQKRADELMKDRNESMLDVHQKKKNNEAESSNGLQPGERRPFDREKDMEVRGLKNASVSEIKEKVGQLGSRFGHSSQQKFL